ncbi:MAG: hypothetical protein HC895_11070 [Leptolyngbyaceae cyanobacterium SM1_3_5]|nr:hypothetical protein [Leptolyngbyaceae cyanobacterium SM1_3_5]
MQKVGLPRMSIALEAETSIVNAAFENHQISIDSIWDEAIAQHKPIRN